ncbi:holin [Mycolicibacterium brisbanense]|uniref:Phage protein, holin n=1 Tax=Mycolicibacterium brisbanense TaxID=146020 RepID=A0A117I868_9MYCO|nr:holin [Mycolicibacterium brisbanense]GAS92704.1 phage protein, holin [Mycolicibacterium brisbanense]
MQITIPPIPPFLLDLGERAVKTFAGTLLTVLTGGIVGTMSLTSLPWAEALNTAAGTTVVSIIFSLASAQWGDKTASLVKQVEYKLTGGVKTLSLPFRRAR